MPLKKLNNNENLLSLALVLFTTTAFAQDAKKDTTYKIDYTDTAGFAQYGMHYYDARIYTYLPADATKQDTTLNPYKFITIRKKKKHK